MRRRQLELVLQALLVLIAGMLGIVTNYATGTDEPPPALDLLQRAAVPGIGVLIILMVVLHIAAHRLGRPAPPPRVWDRDRIPYPGLDAFTEAESAVFFGREGQVDELVRRLHGQGGEAADRCVTLVGASGSGKSSLVGAGVLPRLRQRRWMILHIPAPGAAPLSALAAPLAEALGEDPGRVQRRLRRDTDALGEELRRFRGDRRFRRVLLVVDQLEETITLASERERSLFLDALRVAMEGDPRLWALSTLRIEFLGPMLETSHAPLFRTPVTVGSLSRRQLVQAVEAPGALVGMGFAPGIVDTIVDEVGTGDALPLLAYLLQELYYAVGPGGVVTENDYRRLGGVAGALSRQADQTLAELRTMHGLTAVSRVLLKCVTVEGQDVTRRRVALAELSAEERRIVDAFVEARLLIVDTAPVGEEGSEERGAVVHVAHEALFRQWPPLRQEVEASAERLRNRAELERWADDWRRSGRSDDYLLSGDRLTLAQQWLLALEETGQDSPHTRALVEESRRRDLAFLRRVSESVGRHVLTRADRYPELSVLLSLAALSECTPTPAAERALMTSLSFSHLREQVAFHHDAVRQVVWSSDGGRLATASRDGSVAVLEARSGRVLSTYQGDGAMVESVAWSPDGRKLVVASRDRALRVIDIEAGTRHVLSGLTDFGRGVAWSPDGDWIAATSRDRMVRVWKATSGKLESGFVGHTDDVWGVAWSPNGHRLATASHDRTVIVRDAVSGMVVSTLRGHTGFVEGVAWSPDGTEIATASGDRTVRVWEADSGRQRLLVRGHSDYVWNVAWSPDGSMLASCSSDRTVRIFDAKDAEPISVLSGHEDTVWSVAWSPDGACLATGSADTTVRIWDLRPQGAETTLMDHGRSAVNRAVWSPDGLMMATAGADGVLGIRDSFGGEIGSSHQFADEITALAWGPPGRSGSRNESLLVLATGDGAVRALRSSRLVPVLEVGFDEAIEAVACAPDGKRIAVAGHDAVIRVCDSHTSAVIAQFNGHQDWVGALDWSPGGNALASGSDDRTCRIWDLDTGEQRTVLRGHEGYVDGVAWSPDESLVATASADRTLALWDANTGVRRKKLVGHEARVRCVAWSPDGEFLASGADDGTVRVWSPADRDTARVIGVHRGAVMSVDWSPDGSAVLTASRDGTARVWATAPDFRRLQARARARVARTLTEEERRHHMLPLSE
ncbi:AAA family ATPase [Streptomyces sp. ST2-7A]|uniref:nSTAND1 domain-containing NTPase n=1 Tax=Streptomyces sp. ST2-7A TaxID=2907214 RepID=UPI001F34309C|nr:AAA family ATPase [Streptomyces sp. ST2-7A]MCE7082840.1 WD40 repeat domain-containing protein [Streptomyces sp. ST2-7A]